MTIPSSPQRKKIFFLHGFQLRYTLLVAGSLSVLLLFAGFHGIFIALSSLPGDVLESFKGDLMSSTWRLFLVGFLYISVVSVAAIFLSHRTIGPTSRLEEELNNMAKSDEDLRPLEIRDGDELESLVKSINNVIDRVNGKDK